MEALGHDVAQMFIVPFHLVAFFARYCHSSHRSVSFQLPYAVRVAQAMRGANGIGRPHGLTARR